MTGICNTERLLEFARRGVEPDTALRVHLRTCIGCRERFEAQKHLSRELGILRALSVDSRSSAASGDALMQRFSASRKPVVSSNRWLWSFAAAAVLLLSLVLVRTPHRALVTPAAIRVAVPDSPAYLALSDSQDEGFIAVPYVPPLATGELMRVVHTELYPAALASLGVSVDPSLTSGVSADLLMGEDGFPRAIRVSNEVF